MAYRICVPHSKKLLGFQGRERKKNVIWVHWKVKEDSFFFILSTSTHKTWPNISFEATKKRAVHATIYYYWKKELFRSCVCLCRLETHHRERKEILYEVLAGQNIFNNKKSKRDGLCTLIITTDIFVPLREEKKRRILLVSIASNWSCKTGKKW